MATPAVLRRVLHALVDDGVDQIAAVAAALNSRPRKTLAWNAGRGAGPITYIGHVRAKVLATLDGVLHIAIVTTRGDDMRVISLRRANRAERRIYERYTQAQSRSPG